MQAGGNMQAEEKYATRGKICKRGEDMQAGVNLPLFFCGVASGCKFVPKRLVENIRPKMFSWLCLRYFLKYSFYCYALEMPCLSRPTKGLDSPICRDTKSFATKQREGDGGLGEGGHFHDPVKQQNFDNDRYSI